MKRTATTIMRRTMSLVWKSSAHNRLTSPSPARVCETLLPRK